MESLYHSRETLQAKGFEEEKSEQYNVDRWFYRNGNISLSLSVSLNITSRRQIFQNDGNLKICSSIKGTGKMIKIDFSETPKMNERLATIQGVLMQENISSRRW